MAQQVISGTWKLVDVTNSNVSGQKFHITWHFVSEEHVYICNQGELGRFRYRATTGAEPAEIDLEDSLGIFKLEGKRLWIRRAMPGQPRPTTFENASVSVYEYIGEGPADWKTRYKQQIRKQLERIAEEYRLQDEDDSFPG